MKKYIIKNPVPTAKQLAKTLGISDEHYQSVVDIMKSKPKR